MINCNLDMILQYDTIRVEILLLVTDLTTIKRSEAATGNLGSSARHCSVLSRGRIIATMSPPLPFATTGDILRAAAKDDEYVSLLTSALNEVLLTLLPNSATSNPRTTRIASTAARLLYFLMPLQRPVPTTPGEEYAALLPVRTTSSYTRMPSQGALVLRALGQLPNSEELLTALRFVWRSASTSRFPSDAIMALLTSAQRLHTASFYLCGAYQSPASRIANLRYLSVSLRTGIGISEVWLRLLGTIAIFQVLADLVNALRRAVTRSRQVRRESRVGQIPPTKQFLRRVVWCLIFPRESMEDESEEEENSDAPKCILCLDGVKDPTLTRCGHVFCWRCICGWCAENVCPYSTNRVCSESFVGIC